VRNVYINDIAVFLPNEAVDNENIEAVLGQLGTRPSRAKRLILRSNKIKTRYYAIDPKTGESTHTNTQLTALAVKQLQDSSFDINSIDLLACGTSLPDQIMPNHALMVHGELGMRPCEVIATSGICLSGVMSLKYAYMSILSEQSEVAVATGSENSSSLMSAGNFSGEIKENKENIEGLEKSPELAFEKDFLRWMLSDGAGAALLTSKPNKKSPSLKIEWIRQKSYANELEACMYSGAQKDKKGQLKGWREYTPLQWSEDSVFTLKQDVKLLNDKIVEYTVVKLLKDLVEEGKVKAQEIDWFLPHYSSAYFRDKLYTGIKEAGCDIPQEKWFTNLESKGNTGSASIYIILEELLHSNKLKVGDKLLCYIPESGRFSTAYMLLSVV